MPFTARQGLDDIPETSQFLPLPETFLSKDHVLGLLNTEERIRRVFNMKTEEDLGITAVEGMLGF